MNERQLKKGVAIAKRWLKNEVGGLTFCKTIDRLGIRTEDLVTVVSMARQANAAERADEAKGREWAKWIRRKRGQRHERV